VDEELFDFFPRALFANDLRAIFKAAPLDRILLETDSPYLAPPPHRGRRNEPAYTAHTAAVGAALYGLTLEDLTQQQKLYYLDQEKYVKLHDMIKFHI
jgi:Tat protein secretion system quality control protein TatD with DNase activity